MKLGGEPALPGSRAPALGLWVGTVRRGEVWAVVRLGAPVLSLALVPRTVHHGETQGRGSPGLSPGHTERSLVPEPWATARCPHPRGSWEPMGPPHHGGRGGPPSPRASLSSGQRLHRARQHLHSEPLSAWRHLPPE